MFVTFDDLAAPGRILNGQYPAGVIDWGQNAWWLSEPYGKFATQSVSFNGDGPTSATFGFIGTHTLWQVDAYNGGDTPSVVTITCRRHVTATATLAAGQLSTIPVGWSTPCRTVAISSSNGYYTNFDNFKIK